MTEQVDLEKKPVKVPLDVVMFVGKGFYSRESFVAESKKFGACKKFGGAIPPQITVGKSRVFLAQEGEIFAYFIIRGILVVGAEKIIEKEGIKVQYISGAEAASFQDRGCGKLVVGGTYFVSEEDMAKLQKYADSAIGQIELIEPPIPLELKRFRGFKYVLGDKILARAPEEEWYDVKDIRKANTKILAKLHPKKPDEKPKPKRETFQETVINVLEEFGAATIDMESLIQASIFRNAPFATNKRRVYRSVIGKLAKNGVLEITKHKNGAHVLKIDKKLMECLAKSKKEEVSDDSDIM